MGNVQTTELAYVLQHNALDPLYYLLFTWSTLLFTIYLFLGLHIDF